MSVTRTLPWNAAGGEVSGRFGLRVHDSSVEKQDNEEAAFMWIEAVKRR
jgi:hypothetical protein